MSRRGWSSLNSQLPGLFGYPSCVRFPPRCLPDIKTQVLIIVWVICLSFLSLLSPPTYLSYPMSDELTGGSQSSIVDPEKGLLDSHSDNVKALLPALDVFPAFPPSKEKSPAVTTTTEVVVATKPSKPPSKPKKKVPLWILWTLWFNTYRYIAFPWQRRQTLSLVFIRKFFTFCLCFNLIGLVLAASGHFPYGVKYSGAIVVANLNMAILMRNEVFGRLLYLLVNTLFAKVRAIFMSLLFLLFTPDFTPSGLPCGFVWVARPFCR